MAALWASWKTMVVSNKHRRARLLKTIPMAHRHCLRSAFAQWKTGSLESLRARTAARFKEEVSHTPSSFDTR
jgi:hypothetical protein